MLMQKILLVSCSGMRKTRNRLRISRTCNKPGIDIVLGGHGHQPTDTSLSYLTGDALQQATSAKLASVLAAMQDRGDASFIDQAQARFDLTYDDGIDYAKPMSENDSSLFGSSFTSFGDSGG